MSLTTGVAGLPFQWGPDGRHQYAEVMITDFIAAGSAGKNSTLEVTVPSGRCAYFVYVDMSGSSGFNIVSNTSAATMDGGGTAVTIEDEYSNGSISPASTMKVGQAAALTSTLSEVPQLNGPETPVQFYYPFVVPGGRFFQIQNKAADEQASFTLRWYEKVVPT